MICIYQGAAKVSILMIGQQAIMDAYLCLLHLTAGILVGKSRNESVASCACLKFQIIFLCEKLTALVDGLNLFGQWH